MTWTIKWEKNDNGEICERVCMDWEEAMGQFISCINDYFTIRVWWYWQDKIMCAYTVVGDEVVITKELC